MANRINPNEIDEQFIIASVSNGRTSAKEIAPQPLNPLPATVPATVPVQPEEQKKAEEHTKPDNEMPVSTPEPVKDETRTKRGGQQEYESLFIKECDLPPARFGKSVYIRKEYHDRISQIISVIGCNEVSLFAYIDNVMAHHFENFRDDIARSFKKKTIFK